MNDFEHEHLEDNFEVEISDLEPVSVPLASTLAGRIPLVAGALCSRLSPRTRKHSGWLALTLVSLLLILVLFPGGLSSMHGRALGLFARPTPVPAAPSGGVPIAGRFASSYPLHSMIIIVKSLDKNLTPPAAVPAHAILGPAPQHCPPSVSLQDFDAANFSPGVGELPTWVVGFDGPSINLTQLQRAKQSSYGWFRPILLVLETDLKGPVTLWGGGISNHSFLWFSDRHSKGNPTESSIRLLPNDPAITRYTGFDDQAWLVWPADLYIPAAGCYYLQATWPGGSWMVFFAAGA